MSLSAPKLLYGVHSVCPYSRTTGLPYGILKVVGSANLTISSEKEKLYGGSQKYAWGSEVKTITSEVAMKVKAFEGFMFELFLGATVTESSADTSGAITTAANKNGTSVIDATTGIASIAINASTKTSLKFGRYVVKAVNATTVNFYVLSDVDFDRGTDVSYQSDSLEVLAAAVTVTDSGGTTDVDSLGITITGGSGTVAMTADDTATFEIKPPSSVSSVIVLGKASASFPEFGAVFVSQRLSDGQMCEVNAYKCSAAGFPIAMTENAWAETDITIDMLYDSVLDKLAEIRMISPT